MPMLNNIITKEHRHETNGNKTEPGAGTGRRPHKQSHRQARTNTHIISIMSQSLRSRPSKESDPSDMPRVRHRNHHLGTSPPDHNLSTSIPRTSPQNHPKPSLSINTQNGDRSPTHRPSPTYNMASPKVHGRRTTTFDRFERTTKFKLVLCGSLLVFSFCMMGVWMTSDQLENPRVMRQRPHGYYPSRKVRRQGGETISYPKKRSVNREMEVYRPLPNRRAINKGVKTGGEMNAERRDAGTDPPMESRQDSSADDDNKNSIQFFVPSSHVDSPSQDVDMRIWGYASRPRVLHCDFQLIKQKSRNSNANQATLKAVNRLPTHETKKLLPSERYISSYPDDDDHLARRIHIKKNSKKYKQHEAEQFDTPECKSMYPWQNQAYPNCNNLHEYELGQLTAMHGRVTREALNIREGEGDEEVIYWSHGYWRDVWLLSKSSNARKQGEIAVLKTLRMQHDFTDRNYDRHRKDALASERLKKSPNVVDIYAYCSNSAVFEYGDGGDIDLRVWPFDRKEKKHYVAELTSFEKVDIAYQVARAIADIHEVEEDGLPSIVHTDITPTQFILIDGRYKVNDFNRCRFMRVNVTDNSQCGFKVGANPGKFRAPEEYNYQIENEKIDIYSMGNIFYSLISGNMPFENYKEKEAQIMVKNGERPEIPEDALRSDETAIKALVSVIQRCWKQDPRKRPTASSVRDELKIVLDGMSKDDLMDQSEP